MSEVHAHGTSTPLDWIRIAISLFLLGFSIVIVMALIATGNTKIASDVHPAAAAVILWVCIIWMSMVEGGQCSMVGLPPIDRSLYKESHPKTWQICEWGHKGDNLDRYLMGRQFMVIFINFTISLAGAPLAGAEVLGLPQWIISIFLESGIAMVLTNVIIGQLTSQVNASHCMLDYINNNFMVFTYWVAALIEVTGVMHTSYLIRYMAYWAAGKPVESNEPPRDGIQKLWFWGRVVWSLGILGFALAVTLEALFKGQTALWEGVPEVVGLILFFVLMCVVGLLEGMQIAFFAVSKLPKSERGEAPMALRTCECLFKNGGRNLPGFMCGRQMTVTLCFFIIARVTTIQVGEGEGNVFGVNDTLQNFFNTGFLGAIITTILGSISWQLVASAFPLAFLSNPIVYIFLQLALALEATGICAAAWFLALIQKKIMGFQYDEVYVGTPEERAAGKHADDPDALDNLDMGTNVLQQPVGAHELPRSFLQKFEEGSYSEQRERILKKILYLREKESQAMNGEERAFFKHALKYEIQGLKALNDEENEEIGDTTDGTPSGDLEEVLD
ncbi:silicon transporter [Nitzschia inconspicua]|uniref:Silicon transporter n=1 Tax=Nitzschia inconspicua TaxID=303405 RepID=A0A9K3P996_9STRA|nr:silicon transporter [Nitzschia inconspicua]KAG7350765.1 silicon transporter [Nitzschia inconspicua]